MNWHEAAKMFEEAAELLRTWGLHGGMLHGQGRPLADDVNRLKAYAQRAREKAKEDES